MTGKLVSATAFVAIAYVIPLFGHWDLFLDPRPWLAIVAAFILIAAQPTLGRDEERRTRATDRSTAPLIMLTSLGSQVAILLEWRVRPRPAELGSWWTLALAVGVLLAGLVLRIHAIRVLGPRFTASVRVDPDHELVQRGAYRFVRHPSYAGALLVVAGMALMFGSSIAGVGSALLLVVVYRKRISLEETALESALGAAYRVYRERTWCLLPGIW